MVMPKTEEHMVPDPGNPGGVRSRRPSATGPRATPLAVPGSVSVLSYWRNQSRATNSWS